LKDPEFEVFDFDKQVMQVESLVAKCRDQLKSNRIETIPHFNEIMNRELDAVVDTLTKIDHFHASARCARAALELTMINLYGRFYPVGKGLINDSFRTKYGVRGLTHRTKSPILKLVRDGILDEVEFGFFVESYGYLSDYVHNRVTYHLCHIMPRTIVSVEWYAEALRLAGKQGRTARIVKATLINYCLVPGLETLNMLLKSYKRVKK
jgi:hypothetical protein